MALEYMGLRTAPRLWQVLVLGWLVIVWLAIGVAWVVGHAAGAA